MENDSEISFIEKINKALIFLVDSSGKIIKKSDSGSVELPCIDYEKTRMNFKRLVESDFAQYSPEEFLSLIHASTLLITKRYVNSHDGWRPKSGDKDFINLDRFVPFFKGLKILFEESAKIIAIKPDGSKIGIGVIFPAKQDIGKDIIRIAWIASGNRVDDLGRDQKSDIFINYLVEKKPDILAVSCMMNECVDELRNLFREMNRKGLFTPVIIGGIAVNRVIAYRFSQEFKIPLYYCKDVSVADMYLLKALHHNPIEIPDIRYPSKYDLDAVIVELAQETGFTLYILPIKSVIIDQNSREHCDTCPEYKKNRCPLQIGFEIQLDLPTSKVFVQKFNNAVLASTSLTTRESTNNVREYDKNVWKNLCAIEELFARKYGDAVSFKLPLVCPFCLPKDCTIMNHGSKNMGYCNELYYRKLHETYNINVSETVKQILGEDIGANMFSVILYNSSSSGSKDNAFDLQELPS